MLGVGLVGHVVICDGLQCPYTASCGLASPGIYSSMVRISRSESVHQIRSATSARDALRRSAELALSAAMTAIYVYP